MVRAVQDLVEFILCKLHSVPLHHFAGNRSCSALTVHSVCRSALHASTAACAAVSVVMPVTPLATAAARIFPSSVRAPRPLGVLITSAIWWFFMWSIRSGRFSRGRLLRHLLQQHL